MLAKETAKIAFAPNFALFGVPSRFIKVLSISFILNGDLPIRAGVIIV